MVKITETEKNNNFTFGNLSDKELRNLEIFELIRKRGATSRTEITKITGINIVSVSNYINDYMKNSLVLEKGLDVSSGGRKPELVELNKDGNYVIGVDLAKEETRISLADLGMNVIEKAVYAQGKIADFIDDLIKKVKTAKIRAIGIARESSSGIGEELKRHFGIDTFEGSRVSCAAFGEKTMNPNAKVDSLLYIYSSLGETVFIKGNLCEVGDESSEVLRYLKPWPDELSMVNAAREEASKGVGTKIVEIAHGRLTDITEEVVIEAAKDNDEVGSNILMTAGLNLGLRMAYLINLFNPELVVIGGGIEKAGELILGVAKKMVGKLAFYKYANHIKIISGILGRDASSIGAASLAVREIFLRT